MLEMNFCAETGKQEILITCFFDAPRGLVFDTFMDPNLLPHWWGPENMATVVDRMEPKPGGLWRFINRDAQGSKYAFHGVYHEITAPARLVYTFEFEGMPGHVVLETITLSEQCGRTKLTDQSVFQSVEDRDGMLQSGMEEGVYETYRRFAGLLVKIIN